MEAINICLILNNGRKTYPINYVYTKEEGILNLEVQTFIEEYVAEYKKESMSFTAEEIMNAVQERFGGSYKYLENDIEIEF